MRRLALFLLIFLFTSSALAANSAPSLGTVSPAIGYSTSNQAITFTTTYSDPNGWKNIQYAYFLIDSSIGGARCFYAYYDQNTNKLYLRDDANTKWLGGYAPKSGYTVENSYVKLSCLFTTYAGSGNTLTIKWCITFKTPFSGVKNTYLYVRDDYGLSAGWTKKGDYCIFREPVVAPK
jgi:hypothetical protein